MACRKPTCISSYWDMPSALTARQNAPAPPPPFVASAPSFAPPSFEPSATPSSSAVTPCTTSDATSRILNPCEKEKDQNLRSSSPCDGACCSSFSCRRVTCSGDMCVNCCLHASRGSPRCASRECSEALPCSRHVCRRVATYGEWVMASYRDQCLSMENRNSSEYCTRRSSNARTTFPSSNTRTFGASASGRLLTCVASSMTPAVYASCDRRWCTYWSVKETIASHNGKCFSSESLCASCAMSYITKPAARP
mmetsp:Transcript_9422/g.40010  ORF Transcript_9422/g.40010 Transcript_9422/m.40010 type:complete len:252 (-) Transcript_9422:679-1434(-)